MKIGIFLLFTLFCYGCSKSVRELKKIEKKLAHGTWETIYKVSNSDSLKIEYSIFKDFRYHEGKLVCAQEFERKKSYFIVFYFEYNDGKLLRCLNETQTCREIYLGEDFMYVFYINEKGEETFQKYIKRK